MDSPATEEETAESMWNTYLFFSLSLFSLSFSRISSTTKIFEHLVWGMFVLVEPVIKYHSLRAFVSVYTRVSELPKPLNRYSGMLTSLVWDLMESFTVP